MANVGPEQIAYWRHTYGIHLVGYETITRPDGTADHSPLSLLLDQLLQGNKRPTSLTPVSATQVVKEDTPRTINSAESLLALARYANKMMRVAKVSPEVPIRVYANHVTGNRTEVAQNNPFNGLIAEQFLINGPTKAVLLGAPGAGKSYAIRQASASIADSLYKACLDEQLNVSHLRVPFIIDLKQYNGSLWSMMQDALPTSLNLEELLPVVKVKIYLDSFNEMPREYRENGQYEADFITFIRYTNY
ncbi:MAG: hypothetical protein EOO61_10705 [Hymenobacter sp.]|nr:MAG: hypothetical protein EOO61_10705 [Hymenobacter sp.]